MQYFDTLPKIIVYNFWADWCGWSKRFLPEWQKFMDIVSNNPNLQIVAVDVLCDNPLKDGDTKQENDLKIRNKQLKEQYEKYIEGYPTVLIVLPDDTVIQYNKERTSDAILEALEPYSQQLQ